MLFKRINLEFFKGGSTTTQVQKRDPKSAQHLALDNSIYGLLSPLAERYGGTSVAAYAPQVNYLQPAPVNNNYYRGSYRSGDSRGDAGYQRRYAQNYGRTPSPQPGQVASNGKGGTSGGSSSALANFNNSQLGKNFDIADQQSALANQNSLDLLQNNGMNLALSQNALQKAEYLADTYRSPYQANDYDNYIDKMGQIVDQSTQYATKYYDDADWYLEQNKDLSSRGTNQALENYMSEIYKSINSNFSNSAASLLNDAAGKGVINSSIAHRGIAGLSNDASSAAGEQYAGGFQTLLNNSLQGAQTAGNLAQNVVSTANTSTNNYKDVINSMLGVNQDSLATMQGRAGVLTNASQGYNRDYNSGLQGLETYAKLPTTYYQNALAPVSPLYNYWKDMTDAYYGHEDFDTVVSSNGK